MVWAAIEVTLLLFKGKQEPQPVRSVDLLRTGRHVGQLCVLLGTKAGHMQCHKFGRPASFSHPDGNIM